MDYSPFYYTYSTVAQTLAGAFGFLGAVVLFRLQSLESSISRFAETANQNIKDGSSGGASPFILRQRGEWGEFVNAIREGIRAKKEQGRLSPSILKATERFVSEIDARLGQMESIKKGLGMSLVLTAGTIAACLIFLPLTREGTPLSASQAGWPVLTVVVFFAVGTLCSYIPLVGDLVKLGFESNEEDGNQLVP